MHRCVPLASKGSRARQGGWHVALLALGTMAAGCDTASLFGQPGLAAPLTVTGVGPAPLVAGGPLVLEGSGFRPAGAPAVSLRVRMGPRGSDAVWEGEAEVRSDGAAMIAGAGDVVAAWASEAGASDVVVWIDVERTVPDAAPPLRDTVRIVTTLSAVLELAPVIASVEPASWAVGDVVTLRGAQLPLAAESDGPGPSLIITGWIASEDPPGATSVGPLAVPVTEGTLMGRDTLRLPLTADVLGVGAGRFHGTLTLEGGPAWKTSAPWGTPPGEGVALLGPQLLEAPAEASAGVVRRGAWAVAAVRGAPDPEDGVGTAWLALDGEHRPDRGEPVVVEALKPVRWFAERALAPADGVGRLFAAVLRGDGDGAAAGTVAGWLADTPGTFEGSARLVVAGPAGAVADSEPLPVVLRVEAPLQHVEVRALPGFDAALEAFGLLAARQRVLDGIVAGAGAPYDGLGVRFSKSPPVPLDAEHPEAADVALHSVVELGDRDPNDSGLFGLDNTDGKDVGNRRLDDVLGGFNADTRSGGLVAFGGVFVGEQLAFSPTLADGPLVDPRFDTIFSVCVPALGGVPALPGELDEDSPRGSALREAASVLASLVAHTVAHEVGHSLGLAAIDGQFHNPGDGPRLLMDAGVHRPFGERAGFEGEGPSVLSAANRVYLEGVLSAAAAPRRLPR